MRVCRKKTKSNKKQVRKRIGEYSTTNVEVEECKEVADNEVLNLYQLGVKRNPPIAVDMEMNGSPVQIEIDTGTSLKVMSEKMSKELGSERESIALQSISAKLCTGEVIEPLRFARFLVKYGEKEANLPLIVTPGSYPALLGQNWLQEFKLDWPKLLNVTELKESKDNAKLESLLSSHQDVFKDELGCMKDFKVNIKLKQNAKPHILKANQCLMQIKAK